MRLPEGSFDGIFANASLFHVPSQELPRVLLELFQTLRLRGVLFSSNPRGNNEEGFGDGRYACFFDLGTWRDYVIRPVSSNCTTITARPACRERGNLGSLPFGASLNRESRAIIYLRNTPLEVDFRLPAARAGG